MRLRESSSTVIVKLEQQNFFFEKEQKSNIIRIEFVVFFEPKHK